MSDSIWSKVEATKDAFWISTEFSFSAVCLLRPAWWKKMQRWPLSWVLHAMVWCRLTGLKEVER